MIARQKRENFGNAATQARGGEQGYVLAVFILLTALLFVGLTAIIPKAVFEGRREREEELIFRGTQYQRAIQLFVRKFGRYPNSIDDLVKTNNIRFLRKRYKDPMTKEGEWRIIHVGPSGAFVDATTSPAGAAASLSISSSTTSGSGSTPSPQTSPGGQTSQPGGSPQPGAGPTSGQSGGPGSFSLGGPSGGNPQDSAGQTPGGLGLTPQQQQPPAAQGGQPSATTPGGTPGAAGPQPASNSPVFGGGGGGVGAIAGFASMSKDQSIKIWPAVNGFDEYDKWEFIYDYRKDPVAVASVARTSPPQQPTPALPQQPVQPPTNTFPGAPQQPAAPGGFGGNPGAPGFPRFPPTSPTPFPGK